MRTVPLLTLSAPISLSPISTYLLSPPTPLLFRLSIVLQKPSPDWLTLSIVLQVALLSIVLQVAPLSIVLQVAPLSIVLLWRHSLLFSHGHSHALAVYKPLGRQHVSSDLI